MVGQSTSLYEDGQPFLCVSDWKHMGKTGSALQSLSFLICNSKNHLFCEYRISNEACNQERVCVLVNRSHCFVHNVKPCNEVLSSQIPIISILVKSLTQLPLIKH